MKLHRNMILLYLMEDNLKQGYKRKPSQETKRYCQFLRLNSYTLDDYKYWHSSKNIWKEIPQGIREVGILDMEIYLIENMSFMVVETTMDFEWDKAFDKLAGLEKQAEWEDFVSRFQDADEGKRSEEKWMLIDRIFSLQEALGELSE